MTFELGLILIFIVLGLAVLPLKLGLWRHLSGRRSKICDRDELIPSPQEDADIERDQDDKDVRMALAWHDQYDSQERRDTRDRREAELEAERVQMEEDDDEEPPAAPVRVPRP